MEYIQLFSYIYSVCIYNNNIMCIHLYDVSTLINKDIFCFKIYWNGSMVKLLQHHCQMSLLCSKIQIGWTIS